MSQLLAILLPIVATLAGGYAVLRTKQSLRSWLSLSGGILLGLVFLDLLPEAVEIASSQNIASAIIGAVMLCSILLFHSLDKLFDFHGHEGHEHPCENHQHRSAHAWARVSGMGFHSFLDGLAVGGGFAASERIGLLITLAVMLHKLTDGMTTATIIQSQEKKSDRRTYVALAAMILLPLLGLVLGKFLTLNKTVIAIFFAFLAGLFTQLSLSELLPQSHEGKTSRFGFALTVVGVSVMAIAHWLTK